MLAGAQPAAVALAGVGGLALVFYGLVAAIVPDARKGGFHWDFATSTIVVLLVTLVGHLLCLRFEGFWDAFEAGYVSSGAGGVFRAPFDYAWSVGDFLYAGCVLSSLVWLVLQRRAVTRFLKSMTTGVSLVVLATIAVTVGVLVPQIDGFEDPDQRVDLAKERTTYLDYKELGYIPPEPPPDPDHLQYKAFRWAEGYFLYHLKHMVLGYGRAMPEAEIQQRQIDGLERFGRVYGSGGARQPREGDARRALGPRDQHRDRVAHLQARGSVLAGLSCCPPSST